MTEAHKSFVIDPQLGQPPFATYSLRRLLKPGFLRKCKWTWAASKERLQTCFDCMSRTAANCVAMPQNEAPLLRHRPQVFPHKKRLFVDARATPSLFAPFPFSLFPSTPPLPRHCAIEETLLLPCCSDEEAMKPSCTEHGRRCREELCW